VEAARTCGAGTEWDREVRSWRVDGKCILVETDREKYVTQRLVVAGGPWAGQLLHALGLPLQVLRKPLFWYACEKPLYDVRQRFPAFLFELADGIFYGFPQVDDRGVKVAEHTGGRTVLDPLDVDRSIDQQERARVENFLADHLPQVSRRLVHHCVCMYTMTPDQHFIVDQYPEFSRVAFATGLSGHGFKFTPVLGKVLAELVLDNRTSEPIGFLALNRFAS
jgi:sarcosine oxidase